MSNENKSLTPDIEPMLDEAFNKGVDQAIDIVKGMFAIGLPSNAEVITNLLEKLKKP